MAYGVKYQATEKSLDGNNYTVKILQNGYTGSVIPFTPGNPAAIVHWGQERSDTYEPIIPSNADVMIFDKSGVIQQDIFFADDDMFRLQIEKGTQVYWVGKILTDIFEGSLDIRLASSKLSAIDGLGMLEDVSFDAESRVSFVQAIAEILAVGNLGLNIRVACNWFTPDILSSEDPLAKVQLERKSLWGDEDKKISTMDALKEILFRFGLRFQQSDGVWWIIQRELLGETTFKYFEYDKNGAFVSSQSGFNPAVTMTDAGQYSNRLSGGRRPFFPAYKNTTVRYFPKADSGSLVPNGSFEYWAVPNTPDSWTESEPNLSRRGLFASAGTYSVQLPATYENTPGAFPNKYIRAQGGTVGGIQNKLRIRLGAMLVKNPNNLTVPFDLTPRRAFFSIYYGNYFLKRAGNGTLSWVQQGQGNPYDDYILFKNAGVAAFRSWEEDVVETPPLPVGVGQLTFYLYSVVETEYTPGDENNTAAFSGILFDNFLVELLVTGDAQNEIEGIQTVATSIVLPNTVAKDAIEFTIGDGPSTLTPSRLTIGTTTLTGNWKRGPYSSENPTNKSLDAMLAETWMRAQKVPLEVHRATYTARPSAGALLEAHNVLVIGAKRYAMSSLSRDLIAGNSEGEWILIQSDNSDIVTTIQAVTKDSSTNKIKRDTLFGDGNSVGSETFANGLSGTGWGILKENGKFTLVIDSIRLRESLSGKELLFQQVRATNGSLFVATTGKVKNFTNISN